MRIHQPLFSAAALLLLLAAPATAQLADEAQGNWPRWRGPHANGTAPSANPPLTWSQNENVRWKVEVPGKGSATPIVWNDSIFVLTAIDTGRPGEQETKQKANEGDALGDAAAASGRDRAGSGARPDRAGDRRERGFPGRRGGFGGGEAPTTVYQFCVICYDRASGRERWRQVAAEEVPHEGGHQTNTFASGSPVTDGQFLYLSFGSRGVFCYRLDGHLQWQRDFGQMQTRGAFGEGSSPALHEETLVVPWDHEGSSALYALDARTGEVRWQVERDEPTTWATPLIVQHAGRTQVITNGTNRVRSYDLADGTLIWECGGQATNPIPTPVADQERVYCMTGYRGYAVYAIPLDARGDVTDSEAIAWSRTDAGPYISSPVLYKDQLYFTKGRDGILSSLDPKTGEPIIRQARLPSLSTLYASPVAAADRLYITDREGKTLVIRHGSTVEVLALNELGETIDASPAIAGDQIFLRSERHLYCIENP